MSLYKARATHKYIRSFISLTKNQKSIRQNIKVAGNTLSILDDGNQIIEQLTPSAKILPPGIGNQQINERSLIEAMDDVVKGMNLTVFYIGTSFSGKEELFDGIKGSQALIYHFADRLIPQMKRDYGRVQFRLKMNVIISEKVYDCLSDSRHAILRLKQDKWQGIQINNARTIPIDSASEFMKEMARGIKHKNKLVLEFKEIYTSVLSLQILRKHASNERLNVVNKINIFEIPGVEALADSHNTIKIKESSNSTRSLLSFTAILNDLSKYPDSIPHFESSSLTFLLKQILGGNSLIYSYFTLEVTDVEGALATIKLLKPMENINQYPIINQSDSFGLIKKYRTNAYQSSNRRYEGVDGEKKQLEQQMLRLQTEQDYRRIMEKYVELKNKYNEALKSKSEAQLQLIKCQEEKLEIGKSLVEVQIENTKLLEKLQNKDYQTGKKMLNAENVMADRQMSFQELRQKVNDLNDALNDALESKRDLEVQFIALKRNFLLTQKENKQIKEDNQNLSLDLINVSNENEKLKKQLLNSNPFGDQRSRMVKDLQYEKEEKNKRQRKQMEETIAYLKSQIERYKKEMVQLQMNSNTIQGSRTNDGFGKNYERIELENEKLELINKNKLYVRKIEEIEQKIGFYEEQNGILEDENRKMKVKEHAENERYRKKLEEFTRNTNSQAIIRELRENFTRKDTDNLDKINSLKRQLNERKRQIVKLKGYMRQLQALLEEWGPKGVDIPSIKKYENMDFVNEGTNGNTDDLKIRNIKLEEQLRRVKQSMSGSPEFRSSRVSQQMSILQGSNVNRDLENLRTQKNSLAEQNRRLTVLLKDGNKMDLNILKKENEQLRRQLQNMKGKNSISPSTSDQKLVFYEKHLKALEKERSELLSRCTVAEEQLKNVLGKVGKNAAY